MKALKIIGGLIITIISVSAVIGLVAGIVEYVNQIREQKKAKREGKKNHKFGGIYEQFFKRLLDAFLSTGAFIIFSPILLATTILVRIKLGSPVFFTQERPGRNEKIFKLYKFRTMTDERDENGELLPDEVRLTPFGGKLRSTSLDGNVIIGQTTKGLENKGFREVSPIHFYRGRDLFSKTYYKFYIDGGRLLFA